jgi:hypothetical protein
MALAPSQGNQGHDRPPREGEPPMIIQRMELVEATPFENDVALLRYEIKK